MQGKGRGTIPSSLIHEALQGLRERGIDSGHVLRAAAIPADFLDDPDACVSAETYGRLWRSISNVLKDEFFGMDSRAMKPGSFELLCQYVLHAPTLREVLLRCLRFFGLVLDDLQGRLEVEGDVAYVLVADAGKQRIEPAPGPMRPFVYGTYLLILYGVACWTIGRRIPLLAAEFQCNEPAYSDAWRALFTPAVSFDRAQTFIALPIDYLRVVPVQTEKSLKNFLRHAPANLLVKYRNGGGISALVQRRLQQRSSLVWPDFLTLAAELNLSPSTLRRRLADEGETYRALRDRCRKGLATSLLGDGNHTIEQVAAQLGFAEASAFHRAFKKWTGSKPGDYRRGVRSQRQAGT